MTSSISTDDGAIQSGSGQASAALESARTGGGRANAPGVDPRLAVAVDDTAEQNRRGGDKVDRGIDTTKRDSTGKTGIDAEGSDGINNIGPALLAGLGGAGSGLMGALGQGGGGQGAQMPQMPQVPAASAGQSLPGLLSGANPSQALASLLSGGAGGGSGAGAGGGVGRALGRGGAGGEGGPTTPGQNEYEQRIIDLANEVVAAGIPYAWGGGTIDGISQGIHDGGAADAAGDYAKQGFDCSGLARYLVYQASGVEIPRVSGDQYGAGYLVSAADARPGDLAFHNNPGQHVMVYVGDGKVVEAQQSGTNIMFSDAAQRGVTQYVRVVDAA
ncbi:resuscitation-promoting factor interacting protein [Mycolicibacterium mageritense DSM 44476 = CIP 104973]|jgi:hypothetical protein|uniref:Putative cell wall-associated hydrolase domain protein n=1 Tax=Mycolicibacterium canariasense TaxID=228230 RepID=A0A124E1V2_MYCCR|nr:MULTISPECIES: NlpC/P60 family protein [Mycolicibacterium]MCC9179473.1 NlpC/P60 family protein [Mycolicibacterium mageritense]MCV7211519.1 C40 family peptidase [Mycolicibacterium canariasense]ORV10544.1 hypothetical protein AWB94_07560 [Mycolicibacterium canariasense]GAS94815.1 putative cell wall-associated hydrolase domain protein [Mycolicibacterium canariasense]